MLKMTMTTATVLVAASLIAAPAMAHPKLMSTMPAADNSTSNSPTEIRLTFSEGLIAKFSGLEVKDQGGKAIAIGAAGLDPKDKKQLVVPLKAPLAAGSYTV